MEEEQLCDKCNGCGFMVTVIEIKGNKSVPMAWDSCSKCFGKGYISWIDVLFDNDSLTKPKGEIDDN